jgi:4-amino-4-deoxy-L-arabinose transferase-like glycosyltransferase
VQPLELNVRRIINERSNAIAAALILIAALRMVPTYRIFSATADEATHVGAGLEVFQFHQYLLQRENPPVARVVLAIAPQLGGMRYKPGGTYGEELHSVFYGTGKYERNLFLSRVGNIVFLAIASWALFLWIKREVDAETAVLTVFLFTFQPVILGHGALATNDIGATAGLAVSLLAFAHWLRDRTFGRGSLMAAAYAFAITTKFSNLAFVPLACGGVFLVRCIRQRPPFRSTASAVVRLMAAIVVVTPLVIWAVYVFTIGQLSDLDVVADAFPPRVQRFIHEHPTMALPAPGFVWGVASVIRIDRQGHPSYFRGEVRRAGWKLYFPVTIALKTTIPYLLLIAAAAFALIRAPATAGAIVECAAAVALILLLASRSNLDLGIRYVLPVLVPLTVIAAASAVAIARRSQLGAICVAIVLTAH